MALLPALRRDAPLAPRVAAPRPRRAEGDPVPPPPDPQPPNPASAPPIDPRLDGISKDPPPDADLLRQQAAFDRMLAERAERQREANAIRDLTMEQLKKDEEVLKKLIEMI